MVSGAGDDRKNGGAPNSASKKAQSSSSNADVAIVPRVVLTSMMGEVQGLAAGLACTTALLPAAQLLGRVGAALQAQAGFGVAVERIETHVLAEALVARWGRLTRAERDALRDILGGEVEHA